MSKKTVHIRSLADYVRCIASMKEPASDMPLYKKEIVYRGLSNTNYSLVPSICRCPSPYWFNTLQSKELDLIEQAQLRFPTLFPEEKYPIFRLAKLQHYGIPTRMMDVTSNALVALYFACQKSEDKIEHDGEVVVFSDYVHSAFLPIPNAIADTAPLCHNAITPISAVLFRAKKQPYYGREGYPYSDGMDKDSVERFRKLTSKPLIVDVGNLTERQKNQHGKFIIFPNIARKFNKEYSIWDELVVLNKNNRMIQKRIIIPAATKDIILTQLKRFGISKDYLFADDVDTVNRIIIDRVKSMYSHD